ncbi:T9SS type A sorting domain-containing protein [Flavobacterium jejuense]|uniref:T9SS type A sorting domain-containing protein n=1 Tax=Flavobacterium jejuense TaxID=1544455 RepID=A0ABX0IWC9_9FLAO|nr:T9SS type A sorting domain-containing protein [Flavobacterium jejuense]NHN26818.1 T9SS type A sorting domain-containing protein [Flavobacterium jejuense]
MKKKLLYLFSFFSIICYSQWTSQSTGFSSTSTGVEDINIVDANTVWALGYDGSSSTPANYQLFTRTSDGGASWTSGSINVGNINLELTNISPVSATTAWVGAVSPTNGMGGVWKTSNGGTTWVQQNATAYTNPSSFFNVVHFFDANIGITQGDPITATDFEVYRTTNGGTTWTAVPAASLPNIISGEYGYNGGNVAAGNSFWFVTNMGKLYRTTDMGVTWTKLNTPISDFSGTNVGGSIYFSDDNTGVLLARSGPVATATYTLYTTSNGGSTWSAGTPYTHPYRSLSFIPGTTILVGTASDNDTATYSSAYSTDLGASWVNIDSGVQRTGIKFLNGTTGWAGGFTTSVIADGIYKYTGANLKSDSFLALKFNIYPNPVNNIISINSDNLIFDSVSLTDINGRIIKEMDTNSVMNYSFNVSDLNSGIYFLKIKTSEGVLDKKIIKN